MKVLLVTIDLYKDSGGGQTVLKKIIKASHDIDFFYFTDRETSTTPHPHNAHPIPLTKICDLQLLTPPPFVSHELDALTAADQIARSVAGQSFDIVDIPDFMPFGGMLRSAFAYHQVEVGRLVLAMHGNISTTIATNWGTYFEAKTFETQILEREQFDAADGIYSISRRYMREWQAIIDREIHYIDPAHFTCPTTPHLLSSLSKPSLYCIGRSERRKGNDLFVELLRWLDPQSFETAAHIGPPDRGVDGLDSRAILKTIAAHRGVAVEYRDALNAEQLAALFATSCIIVLPVRYDSFNLVALEALFAGCPVAVSSKAGVCDYLDGVYPGLPYLKLDLDHFYAAVGDLQQLVDNYDEHRLQLRAYLVEHPPIPVAPLDVGAIYRAVLANPPRRNAVSSLLIYKEKNKWAGRVVSPKWLNVQLTTRSANYEGTKLWAAFVKLMKASVFLRDQKFFEALTDAWHVPRRFLEISRLRERDEGALRNKLREIYKICCNPLFRCNFWLAIARIERLLGNDQMAVTYELRVLRLMGSDQLNLLPRIIKTLSSCGYVHEAEAVKALYAVPIRAEDNVYTYLKQAYARNLERQEKPFEVLDDRRSGAPKVAVIVSLYKAADKLTFFLECLAEQTLIKKDHVEIILVDSSSPTAEYAVLKAYLEMSPLNIVYARSRERETIQAAWNRGIGLARAPYLVFLGVDETLYPEALEVLADELDRNNEADWVMANSLVTEVNATGLLEKDVMLYDRSGASKHHAYLETCYLSWVGGMYRKSLHQRFGYYDETFSAAGDTEFKNRILPFIKVKFIDKTLGLFLNYPDGQTTASTRAEIEDMRAWYIHRTPGGIRYAFDTAPIEEAEKLLALTLGYRKSYCRHISSDIEYGTYLARYIKMRQPDSCIADLVEPGLADMLEGLRALEFVDRQPTKRKCIMLIAEAGRLATRYQSQHRPALRGLANPCYNVFNDNRYEQHSWLWKSP